MSRMSPKAAITLCSLPIIGLGMWWAYITPPSDPAAPTADSPDTQIVSVRDQPDLSTAEGQEREMLRAHLSKLPDIVESSVIADSAVELVLKPGAKPERALHLARRIEHYMMENYRGSSSTIVSSITMRYNSADASPDSATGQLRDHVDTQAGEDAALIVSGVESTDTETDDTWHIFMGGKEID
jgi:hypothetical protein